MNGFAIGIVFVIGAVVGFWLGKKSKTQTKKKEIKNIVREEAPVIARDIAKQDILKFLETNGRIKNNDVEEILGVSDATATRYLDELEKDGKIIQHKETGRGVFYTLK